MKKVVLITVMSFIFCVSNAQLKNDLIKLKTLKNDTTKAKILGNIGYDYGIQNPDSAMYYYNESKKLAARLNYYTGIIKTNTNIGELYRQMGNFDQSLKSDRINLKLAEKHGNQVEKANCYSNISNSFHYLLKFDSCSKYDLKAQKIYESLADKNPLVVFYNNIATSYAERHLFEKSLEFNFKSLKLYEQGFGEKKDFSYILASISATYLYINQNEKAFLYAQKAIKAARSEKNYYMQFVILGNTLLIKLNQKKYEDLF